MRILLSSEAKLRNHDRSADILRDSPRRLFMLTETLAAHVSARTRAKGLALLPIGRGHRRGRRRVDGPRARAGHARLPCRAGAGHGTGSPAPASARTTRTARRSASTSGPRCWRPNAGDCLPGTVPWTPARSWSPSIGRRRWSASGGAGRVVLDVADEAARAREGAGVAELPRTSSSRTSAAAERAVPLPRFSNGEIIYTIDVRETLAGRGTVINVLFRQRRKNGAWSKPKAVTLTPLEAEHMVDADDREILSLLIGAGHTWTYGAMYDASYQRLSRYVLNGPLEDRVLPMLARSGRGHLDRIGDEHGLFPIGWDDGPAWRFGLEIAARRAARRDSSWTARSSAAASGWRCATRPCSSAAGFSFTRTAMARLELDGGFAWLARLRSVGTDGDPPRAIGRAPRNARAIRRGSAVAARRAAVRGRSTETPRPRVRVEPTRAAEPVRAAGRICARRSRSTTTA